MQAEMKVIGGKQQGKVIPLTMKKFLIGREKDCHLRPNNDLISRHHCVLTVDEYTVRIRDLGSTNGTKVNGQRVTRGALLPGDELAFASVKFRVHLGPDPDPSEEDEANEYEPTEYMRQIDDESVSDEDDFDDMDSQPLGDSANVDVRLLKSDEFDD